MAQAPVISGTELDFLLPTMKWQEENSHSSFPKHISVHTCILHKKINYMRLFIFILKIFGNERTHKKDKTNSFHGFEIIFSCYLWTCKFFLNSTHKKFFNTKHRKSPRDRAVILKKCLQVDVNGILREIWSSFL